jgi:putative tryptophan/tyrosine transport system substrate-binding protein
MNRRAFVTGLGAVLAAPVAADAQQAARVYRVGVLASYPVEPFFRDPFVATLRELGYVEGRDINLVIRSANNIPERWR